MASSKTKTTDAGQAHSEHTTGADATTPATATEAPASGRKLRWTSLPAAAGVAHRTKKPKAKKASTKVEHANATQDARPSGKLSALDAASKVLQEAGQPMNCQELITAMADKGYWTSPAGKTPAATLYSAIAKEIATKGQNARFTKTGRGRFAANS
jgi:hypothetical protein